VSCNHPPVFLLSPSRKSADVLPFALLTYTVSSAHIGSLGLTFWSSKRSYFVSFGSLSLGLAQGETFI
jgi:hypothetical protein